MLSAIERHSRKMASLYELLSGLQQQLPPWVWLLGYWIADSWLTQVYSFIASSQSQGWDVPDPNLKPLSASQRSALKVITGLRKSQDTWKNVAHNFTTVINYKKKKKNMFWLVNLSNVYKSTALTPNVCLRESHTSFCWATSLFWPSVLPPALPLQTSSETDIHWNIFPAWVFVESWKGCLIPHRAGFIHTQEDGMVGPSKQGGMCLPRV